MVKVRNLYPIARADLKAALRYSRTFGVARALQTAEELESRFLQIQAGTAVGHRRDDIPAPDRIRFISVGVILIAFDSSTGQVPRVVDGRVDPQTIYRPFADRSM